MDIKTNKTFCSILFVHVWLLLNGLNHSSAQKFLDRPLNITAKANYGAILPHHESITFYLEDHLRGFEINVGRKADGSEKWHQTYRLPETGFGYYGTNLGNEQFFGHNHNLYGYVKTPWWIRETNFNIFSKMDVGLGYVTRTFSLEDNHMAVVIGSHVNAFIRFSIEGDWKLTENLYSAFGFGFGHISNGRFREPNLGLNSFNVNAGIGYNFNKKAYNKVNPPEVDDTPDPRFAIIACFGRKEISRMVDKQYNAASIILEYYIHRSKRFRYGAGMDLFFDSSVEDYAMFIENNERPADKRYRVAAHLSWEVLVGRTSFGVQPGLYIWNPFDEETPVSNRLALRYQLTDYLLLNVSVKAHWIAIADYVEWGIGYTF